MKKITLTPKLEFAVKLFCVIILILLNIAIYFNGRDLTCNECYIHFTAEKRFGESASNKEFQNFSVKINDLYSGYLEEYCLVEFDSINGYYLKNATRNK